MNNALILLGLLMVSLSSGCVTGNVAGDIDASGTTTLIEEDIMKNRIAVFDTSLGKFKIELYEDEMPVTTGNFIKLANDGFYDGVIFHRIINGFMIQGGDPEGTGTGGPGYTIEDEFIDGLSNVKGTIAMANSGRPNSGGSQFFINLVDNVYLDWDKPPESSKHPVFGKVIEGMDTVEAMGKVDVGAGARPKEDVVINRIVIE